MISLSLSSFLSAHPGYSVVNVCTFDLAHTSHSERCENLSRFCVTSYLSTFLRSHLPTLKGICFLCRSRTIPSSLHFLLSVLWSRHSVTRHTISQWFFRLWQMFTLNNLARESISIRSELVTVDTREKFVILEKRAFLSFFRKKLRKKREKTIRQWSFGKRRPKLVPNQQNAWMASSIFHLFSLFPLRWHSGRWSWPATQTEMRRERCSTQKRNKESWKVALRTFSNDFEMSSRTQKFG